MAAVAAAAVKRLLSNMWKNLKHLHRVSFYQTHTLPKVRIMLLMMLPLLFVLLLLLPHLLMMPVPRVVVIVCC